MILNKTEKKMCSVLWKFVTKEINSNFPIVSVLDQGLNFLIWFVVDL